jgi:hypothetical protein
MVNCLPRKAQVNPVSWRPPTTRPLVMVTAEESNREVRLVLLPHTPLQMIESKVTGSHMITRRESLKDAPENRPVMCDFEIVRDDNNQARFYVSLHLELEDKQGAKGVLQFGITTLTLFEYRDAALPAPLPTDERARWVLFYTGLNVAISTSRGYLTNFLAPTDYRGYILPLLDVKKLVNRKYAGPELPVVPSTAASETPPRKPRTPHQ